ncbi:uncharacterized protein LOC124885622 isoform X1 [Capsicum annuum]|uniref:uncharacterized protein LOC124885622 isoform X1 n=1 Tax=Capsicum annuum TaxID=4072 RepID=UPI001FB12BCB|nr:uncharacterized protein LOC124885622 isoform X1 [Capsicum annuum]
MSAAGESNWKRCNWGYAEKLLLVGCTNYTVMFLAIIEQLVHLFGVRVWERLERLHLLYCCCSICVVLSALQTKADYPSLESALVDCLERVFKTRYGASLIPHYMVFKVKKR